MTTTNNNNNNRFLGHYRQTSQYELIKAFQNQDILSSDLETSRPVGVNGSQMSFLSFSFPFFVGVGGGVKRRRRRCHGRCLPRAPHSFLHRQFCGSPHSLPHKVMEVFTMYNEETFGHVESKNQD